MFISLAPLSWWTRGHQTVLGTPIPHWKQKTSVWRKRDVRGEDGKEEKPKWCSLDYPVGKKYFSVSNLHSLLNTIQSMEGHYIETNCWPPSTTQGLFSKFRHRYFWGKLFVILYRLCCLMLPREKSWWFSWWMWIQGCKKFSEFS